MQQLFLRREAKIVYPPKESPNIPHTIKKITVVFSKLPSFTLGIDYGKNIEH